MFAFVYKLLFFVVGVEEILVVKIKKESNKINFKIKKKKENIIIFALIKDNLTYKTKLVFYGCRK